ncbi:unnamed protein product [Toxocara canis]|uniref:Ubiquitin-like domain-containing protein n=1 Tax=Toxocara canis TaxID=6265 RepID=A0A183VF40_TOXCA|nr:unnamed protein product [Toxocara canis]
MIYNLNIRLDICQRRVIGMLTSTEDASEGVERIRKEKGITDEIASNHRIYFGDSQTAMKEDHFDIEEVDDV